MKKSKSSLGSMLSVVFIWLEKKYKKNKLNFNVIYFASLTSGTLKIASGVSTEHKHLFTDLLILAPLFITVGHFLFYFLYRTLIRKYNLSFSGVGKHKTIYSFDKLTKGGVVSTAKLEGDLVFKTLEFSDHLRSGYVFPKDNRMRKIAGEINYVTFMDTIWSGKSEFNTEDELNALNAKIARNKSHLLRNPKSIMLIKNTNLNWMGFTHIIPVTIAVWEKYLRGEIADNNFADYNICKSGEPAYGFIIFSIGSLLKFSYKTLPTFITEQLDDQINKAMKTEYMLFKEGKGKQYVHNLSKIYKGVLFHLQELLILHAKNADIVPIMVQIEDDGLRRVFIGNNFIKHKGHSKDGYDIYTAHLILTNKELISVD